MTRTLLLHLAEDPQAPIGWTLWEDGRHIAAGDTLVTAPPPADDLRVHAIAPAAAVTLHWIDLPDLAPNQARAAALLIAAEASAAPADGLHIALGARDDDGRWPMAVTDGAAMAGWLARAGAAGHDIVAMHPAPLLIPAPAQGMVRARIGGEGVLRGSGVAGVDDELAALVAGTEPIVETEAGPLDLALAGCPIDLRQGRFARRVRRIDWRLVRWLTVMAGIAAALLLATALVQIARHGLAAQAVETRTATLAARALPAAGDDAAAAIVRRLGELEGAGGGFARLATPVLATLEASPAIDLRRLDYTPAGSLVITLEGPDAPALSAVANAIQARGVRVLLGPSGPIDARVRVELTVRAP